METAQICESRVLYSDIDPGVEQEKNVNKAPEFNHNIMGSSAGAGSGEFHLYRQMRRKEQNRMKVTNISKYLNVSQKKLIKFDQFWDFFLKFCSM